VRDPCGKQGVIDKKLKRKTNKKIETMKRKKLPNSVLTVLARTPAASETQTETKP
jgi:hypothetical protein